MSEPRRVEVGGCYGCPFEYDTISCTHPDRELDNDWNYDIDDDQTQSWCPLHKGPVLVVLKGVE